MAPSITRWGCSRRSCAASLGWPDVSTCMSFGIEVGSYQQLKDAVTYLKENGVRFLDLPSELHPGIDYAAYAVDPEGNGIMLYYYMEQLGWEGRPRPAELRRAVGAEASTHQVEDLAGGAGAPVRHLRGPGLPGADWIIRLAGRPQGRLNGRAGGLCLGNRGSNAMWYLTFSRPAAPREQITPHLQEHLDWQRRMHDSGKGAVLRSFRRPFHGHHPGTRRLTGGREGGARLGAVPRPRSPHLRDH